MAMERRTIYVDQLPEDITHAKLELIFSIYGKVTYVSLPAFGPEKSRKPKGFAFIEFSSDDAAYSALAHNGEIIGNKEVLVISKHAWLLTLAPKKGREDWGNHTRENRKKQRNKNDERIRKKPVQPTVLKFTVGTNVQKLTLGNIFRKIGHFSFIDFQDGATSGFLLANSREDAEALILALHEKTNW